jgi:hypothetical protein
MLELTQLYESEEFDNIPDEWILQGTEVNGIELANKPRYPSMLPDIVLLQKACRLERALSGPPELFYCTTL